MPPSTRARLRFAAWVIVLIAILAGQLLWIALLRGPRLLDSDPVLFAGAMGIVALLALVPLLLLTTPPDAIRLAPRTSRGLIVGGTLFLQISAIGLLLPALSEDLVRYRFDGRMIASGVSPYATSPDEWRHAGRPVDAVDALVMHGQMETIYPPIAQSVFAAARTAEDAIAPAPAPVPGIAANALSPWREALPHLAPVHRGLVLRAIFAGAGVGCVIVLLALLGEMNQSPWWAVLFGWNPLVTLETGGMGHIDIVGVLLLLVTILLIHRRRWIGSAIMLALAAGVKPPVAVLLPFLWRGEMQDHGWRRAWRVPIAGAGALLLWLAPMLLWQSGHEGFFHTVDLYANSWEANGSIYRLIKATANPNDGIDVEQTKALARRAPGVLLVITMAWLWWKRAHIEAAAYWLLLVLLLAAPTVYPWYLIWPLAMVPLLGGRAGWSVLVWSGTILVSYVVWHQPTWIVPRRWALIEYVPVFLVLLIEVGLQYRRVQEPETPQPARTALAGHS